MKTLKQKIIKLLLKLSLVEYSREVAIEISLEDFNKLKQLNPTKGDTIIMERSNGDYWTVKIK
jgi:hypothetical protein